MKRVGLKLVLSPLHHFTAIEAMLDLAVGMSVADIVAIVLSC